MKLKIKIGPFPQEVNCTISYKINTILFYQRFELYPLILSTNQSRDFRFKIHNR